ncbi:MAG TPA: serine hydrolase domain-containing protein [Clostridia bacterium]|nr:serine hydrolase domain-containing protein [Clostridia bacterium]
MNPDRADVALRASMARLVDGLGMLCGLTVCYGTAGSHVIHSTGLSREVRLVDGRFEPAPRKIDSHTIYDLASLTKLYTLVSVLLLVEAGALRLEDDIARLDPRFSSLSGCTLEDCLTYRLSLQTPRRVDAQADAAAARAMVFRTFAVPPVGERLYSDMNALVLKYVLEAVSGVSYIDYLTSQVFAPAGMTETWARVPASRLEDVMDYGLEHRVLNGEYRVMADIQPGQPHDPKARLLSAAGDAPSGHAGLFSTAQDLCRFARALLSGRLLRMDTLRSIGVNRTGYLLGDGSYRQFLGLLCFSKSPVQMKSEVPEWMGLRAFGLAGYTGNHLAIDPDSGVFDLLLGNRCHNRVSQFTPEAAAEGLGIEADGSGSLKWPDGRLVRSSFRFIHQKDRLIHAPVYACLRARGWLRD